MHPIFNESTKLGRLRAIKVFTIQKGAMMKRVLFLLLIANCLQADPVADLEKAVSKGDLQSVEKLLAGDISISADEKAALINLASEIITKRENKIFINNIPKSCRKYLVNNPQLDRLNNIACGLAILVLIIPLIGLPVLNHYSEAIERLTNSSTSTIYLNKNFVLMTLIGIAFGSFLYHVRKYNILVRKLMMDHDKKYGNKRDCAIQIRLLLYKIKVP